MKLVHPEYTFQIRFQEGTVQKLVVESPAVLSEFVVDFKLQLAGKEGKWVLSHDGEVLKIRDHCELIISIFDVDVNQRKMLNVLYEDLSEEVLNTELLADWQNINGTLESILNQASGNLGYDVRYGELELKSLFKAIELKFREREDGYAEDLLEYLQLVSDVRKIKIFVLVNLSSFLTTEEMAYLYEQAFYKKYYLLLLDAQNGCVDQEVEKTIIIDKDYCVIDVAME